MTKLYRVLNTDGYPCIIDTNTNDVTYEVARSMVNRMRDTLAWVVLPVGSAILQRYYDGELGLIEESKSDSQK